MRIEKNALKCVFLLYFVENHHVLILVRIKSLRKNTSIFLCVVWADISNKKSR
jgi:hypothetical protein